MALVPPVDPAGSGLTWLQVLDAQCVKATVTAEVQVGNLSLLPQDQSTPAQVCGESGQCQSLSFTRALLGVS